MEKELENILNEVAKNIYNKPKRDRIKTLFNEKEINENTKLAVTINETDKYAEFHGEYKEKARSIKELKPLLDYIWKNGYKTNLD